MKIACSEFTELGSQMVLPLFEGVDKAPNNSLRGLSRSQRSLVRAVSYTHLRAHETGAYLVCRLLLEKKKEKK